MTDVPNTDPPVVSPGDEGRHVAGDERLWNESWYFDVADPVTADGAYLRLGLYPNRHQTWLHAVVAGRRRPLTVLFDDRAPLIGGDGLGLEVTGWRAHLEPDAPLGAWRVRAGGAGQRFADPKDVFRRRRGEPADMELDLTWTGVAPPYHYGLTTRYEVSARVTGTIRVGDEVIAVDAPGQRDHSWGVRDWWAFGWCWSSGTLEDGTAFHLSDIRMGAGAAGFGYVVTPDGTLTPARAVSATEDLDADGVPTAARCTVEPGGLDLTVVPVALAPILFVEDDGREARMSRLLCRFEAADGRVGSGWTEWNLPPLPTS